jgi:phosphoribosylaminoimidazole carboxylase (NCAIR synthetase)
MTKRTKTPMAQSPLVALAEQAVELDAAHAVLLVRTHDGQKAMYPMDESDPDVLVGMLTWGVAMIFSADIVDIEEDIEE